MPVTRSVKKCKRTQHGGRSLFPPGPAIQCSTTLKWSKRHRSNSSLTKCDEYGYGAYYKRPVVQRTMDCGEIAYSLIRISEKRLRSMPFLELLGLVHAAATCGTGARVQNHLPP
jgi:hypothetical protein